MRLPTALFSLDAVVSIVVPLGTGACVETAMLGNDAVVGAAAAFVGAPASRAIVRIAGEGAACSVEAFRRAAASDEAAAS